MQLALHHWGLFIYTVVTASSHRSDAFSQQASSHAGDRIRLASGKRPSLHPLTINAISELLRRRSLDYCSHGKISEKKTQLQQGLEIVTDALEKRKRACEADGSISSDIFDSVECKAVESRVAGVVSTLDHLETALVSKVMSVPWVAKYSEHRTFGILYDECLQEKRSNTNTTYNLEVMKAILDDPLLRISRAECLLALYLFDTLKAAPSAEILENSPVGRGDAIDFLDDDRKDALLR